MKKAFTAAFCLAVTVGGHAGPASEPEVLSTETLRSWCGSSDADLRRLCSMYVLGVVQGLRVGGSPDVNPKVKCIKDDLAEADLVDAFMTLSGALKVAYPSDMKAPAVSIVSATVASKFSCARQPPVKTKR